MSIEQYNIYHNANNNGLKTIKTINLILDKLDQLILFIEKTYKNLDDNFYELTEKVDEDIRNISKITFDIKFNDILDFKFLISNSIQKPYLFREIRYNNCTNIVYDSSTFLNECTIYYKFYDTLANVDLIKSIDENNIITYNIDQDIFNPIINHEFLYTTSLLLALFTLRDISVEQYETRFDKLH